MERRYIVSANLSVALQMSTKVDGNHKPNNNSFSGFLLRIEMDRRWLRPHLAILRRSESYLGEIEVVRKARKAAREGAATTTRQRQSGGKKNLKVNAQSAERRYGGVASRRVAK
ncbi:hypothetical protein RR46_13277 [Papilio xuthus]|uniref:Uncharacterized protein n=1 Tax=Papilio xuthus TaxID=66420 RepID=A0A194PFB3_PAPXU|nr:hypothetical protein RR46_13277 [Papilio xuthus]